MCPIFQNKKTLSCDEQKRYYKAVSGKYTLVRVHAMET